MIGHGVVVYILLIVSLIDIFVNINRVSAMALSQVFNRTWNTAIFLVLILVLISVQGNAIIYFYSFNFNRRM